METKLLLKKILKEGLVSRPSTWCYPLKLCIFFDYEDEEVIV